MSLAIFITNRFPSRAAPSSTAARYTPAPTARRRSGSTRNRFGKLPAEEKQPLRPSTTACLRRGGSSLKSKRSPRGNGSATKRRSSSPPGASRRLPLGLRFRSLFRFGDRHAPGLRCRVFMLRLHRDPRRVTIGFGLVVELHDRLLTGDQKHQAPAPDRHHSRDPCAGPDGKAPTDKRLGTIAIPA